MPIFENDCYGVKKEQIIREYFLTPLAYLKLIPGQKKVGCCGELKDKFCIFAYTKIKDKKDRGVFFVGYDCAKQMIDLINEKKKLSGAKLLEFPPLFDPTGKGFTSKCYSETLHVNKDALEVILLLASLWDVQSFVGTLPYLLNKIIYEPTQHISKQDLIRLNEIVGKDKDIENLKFKNLRECLQNEDGNFYCPPLLSIHAVLEYMKECAEIDRVFV